MLGAGWAVGWPLLGCAAKPLDQLDWPHLGCPSIPVLVPARTAQGPVTERLVAISQGAAWVGLPSIVLPALCPQVFQLAAHLVYWGKAIIIYPLCENNVYMLSPNASVCL